MRGLFGTDGIRGVAGEDLTADLAFRLGKAVGVLIRERGWQRRLIVGGDTRISGPMIESALCAGLMSTGCDVHLLGVVPTPTVAFLTKHLGFPLGCVISASHNPVEDNGIKFFDSRGMKVEDEVEERLECMLDSGEFENTRAVGGEVGRRYDARASVDEYVKHLAEIGQDRITGLKVVIDGAFGAGSVLAPAVFALLGAQVIPLHCSPDGSRINVRCGATHPEPLRQKVLEESAQLGIALDGDGDRAILVDEKGQVVDGDQVLAMWGLRLSELKAPNAGVVVGTVLSNKGLEVALGRQGVTLLRAPVGDKYVLREMLSSGARIGGEQSGHVVFIEHHTTGDGILTGLMVALLMREKVKPLSELAGCMSRFPQVQLNIEVQDKRAALSDSCVNSQLAELSKRAEQANGRLLVRPSGTEAVIRVMAEAPEEGLAREFATQAIEFLKPFSETGRVTEI